LTNIDHDALKRRYKEERDKRLRADGTAQYLQPEGAFKYILDDPHVDLGFERAPLIECVDVAIIGGGFGGLLAAARLKEAGIDDIRIIEKAGDFGGTWYWNRYPGIQCDIESYIYMPLLEETGYIPTEKYAHGAEIFAHAQAIGRRYSFYDRAAFQTQVTEARWQEQDQRWLILTDRHDRIAARFLMMSTGPLQRPKLPSIPGIGDFKGRMFHTSRWDYDYTGGDCTGGLDKLHDTTVGVIGTGATAIQCIPHLGQSAKRLFVFQRTPASVSVRGNRPTDPAWASTLTAGWQSRRRENFNILISGGVLDEDMVDDGWTKILGGIGYELSVRPDVDGQRRARDFEKMEAVRQRVADTVSDAATAEALKPWYNIMCKRPCFHDEYLATFNLPNVTLVSTDGKGVDRVTETGVVVGGMEYRLDCLVLATGFEWQTDYVRRNGFDIIGIGKQSLKDKWREGVSTFHGYFTRGFPNCFILGNAQSAAGANFTHMLDEGSQHLAWIVRHCLDDNITSLQPTEEAEGQWVAHVSSFSGIKRKYDLECTPSYYNNEGQPSDISVRSGAYLGGSISFLKLLSEWRERGDFTGLEMRRGSEPT
jgi:cyclohexanone monooxygenase